MVEAHFGEKANIIKLNGSWRQIFSDSRFCLLKKQMEVLGMKSTNYQTRMLYKNSDADYIFYDADEDNVIFFMIAQLVF